MNFRIVALGAILLILGLVLFLLPQTVSQFGSGLGLSSLSSTSDHDYLVRVGPGNYSYLQSRLGTDDLMTATVSASPQGVGLFLMNGANFSAWARSGGLPSQVYPQSSLNTKNYSFTFTATGPPQDYVLLFVSTSSTGPTNVLLHLVIRSGTAVSLTTVVIPLTFVAIGAALFLFGARRKKRKESESAEGAEESRASGPYPPPSRPTAPEGVGPTMACPFCGARVRQGSSFCPSCKRSLA